MNYIDAIAARLRDALAPTSSPDALLRAYALLALTVGESVTARDVHNAWAAWKATSGPEHPELISFTDLPAARQRRDDRYATAIREVAASLRLEGGG